MCVFFVRGYAFAVCLTCFERWRSPEVEGVVVMVMAVVAVLRMGGWGRGDGRTNLVGWFLVLCALVNMGHSSFDGHVWMMQ